MSDCHKCGKTNMSEEVTIGDCRMIFGDCREVLPTLPMVDAVIVDPPYSKRCHEGHDRAGSEKAPKKNLDTIV